MIPKSLHEKWCFSKHPLKHGCLGFQERMVRKFPLFISWTWKAVISGLGMSHPAPTSISGK